MKFQWLLQGILDAAEVAGNWVASDTSEVRKGNAIQHDLECHLKTETVLEGGLLRRAKRGQGRAETVTHTAQEEVPTGGMMRRGSKA